MTTPSFGILYLCTGVHISNEKFGLLIGIIYFLLNFSEKKLSVNDIIVVLVLLIAIMLPTIIRLYIYQEVIQPQDISLIVWCISLPIYLSIFRNNVEQNRAIIIILLVIQIFAFVTQLVGKGLDLFDVESIFIHNPIQDGYSYPQVTEGIYRVSGLFNESSQISIFFAIMLWYLKNKKWSILLLPMIVLTFSMTGYLMAIMILFSSRMPKYYLLLTIIITIASYTFFGSVIETLSYRAGLVLSSMSSPNDEGEPRIYALINNMSQIIDRPISGYGALAENVERWDLFSVYIYPYGLIGGGVWLFSIIYFFQKNNVFWFYWPVLLTNATMLSYINLLFVIICVSRFKMLKLDRSD
jgi:hypothetical protein